MHEIFLVRLTDGGLAAVCIYCAWGVRFDMGGGRDAIAQTAVGHIRTMGLKCLDCELGFRGMEEKARHDLVAHRR